MSATKYSVIARSIDDRRLMFTVASGMLYHTACFLLDALHGDGYADRNPHLTLDVKSDAEARGMAS